ncbi:hypothetical protein SELMODRAFT_101998 [Selaginella moellendorffii]|uniref:tRNA (guanine-N(7)-)-methyltransferase n=1 Tax=Selaginella moellendorffii TaxID=88036 RepID=D8RUA0_SELML|nr:tRNA (guanine-N(7)-)-methyltransferase [Selaginella moellendorffii]EFJ24170.1 hypothetical protein SELMODRAFT_101998 [Selaginella moellendorffii]|eukprot:XP_002974650.1 tRNA (guanine-N(7)-)-methyltransferase [Selaginella moellendorffii]
MGNKKGAACAHPRKRFYRARAHSNPLSDSHFPVPVSPAHCDWSEHFPVLAAAGDGSASGQQQQQAPKVRFADVGCGFGGLLVRLSDLYPETLMIGMELRDKVTEYVKERIAALRKNNPGRYGNISVIRTNAMKFLPNYFDKGQLEKMFFLFPDPHFKEKNHRRRIISQGLLAEYAYVMAEGGILYTVTDVQELGEWMKSNLDAHPLFERINLEEQSSDPVVEFLVATSEEGQKVARNRGDTFVAVYRRVPSPP